MSDHELLLPDNSGSGWDNVLLAHKLNNRGRAAIRMSWYASFEKINSRGDVYSGLENTMAFAVTEENTQMHVSVSLNS